MKKIVSIVLALMLLCCAAYAGEQPALEIWANFNDNQKALYSVLDEIDGEIEMVFEYLGNLDMADGSREIVDLLFIIAPEAEDGLYVLDLEDGEFYDHINDKKLGEFVDREHVVNTLANCWASGNTEFLWYDMEVKLYMTAEEIQAVLDAAAENRNEVPESEDGMEFTDHRIAIANVEIEENEDTCKLILTQEQAEANLQRITLTTENWSDYFEDYYHVEHVVKSNSFGEIEYEYDKLTAELRLKPQFIGYGENVAFKFSGMKAYNDGFMPENVWYIEVMAGQEGITEYDHEGNIIQTDYFYPDHSYYSQKDAVVVEMMSRDYLVSVTDDRLYTDYECLDAVGEIVVIELPEELRQAWDSIYIGDYTYNIYLRENY